MEARYCRIMQSLQHRKLSILFLLSLFIATSHSNHACSSYHYDSEPVADLACNPYTSNATDDIRLKCSISGPPIPDYISLTIKWMRTLYSTGAKESLDSLAETTPEAVEILTNPLVGFNSVISVLTLRDVILNDVTGGYYCVVMVTVTDPETNEERVIVSEENTISVIRSEAEYVSEEPCQSGIHGQSGDGACVQFDAEIPEALQVQDPVDTVATSTSLPPPPPPPPTSPPTSPNTTITSSTTPPSQTTLPTDASSEQDERAVAAATEALPSNSSPLGPKGTLSNTMIVILAAIGGTLCIVIHVLLALVSCLWVKSRKKRRVREVSDSRKISTASLISSTPTSLISLPPHHALPTLPSPHAYAGPTGPHALPGPHAPPGPHTPQGPHAPVTSAVSIPLSGQQQYLNALAPPSHPPPIVPSSKLVHPKSHLIQHRSTLPSRLADEVNLDHGGRRGEGGDDHVTSDHEDTYAPVIQARHERRAATIAGDMNFPTSITTPLSPQDMTSPKYDAIEGSYKSLNEYLMDVQQEYQDPNGVRDMFFNEDGEENDEYVKQEGVDYVDKKIKKESSDEDDAEDSDLDSIYMAAIVRNTGRSTSTATTPTADKEAGLLLRDIPLPPQCPIPMPPPSSKLGSSPTTPLGCKLPGMATTQPSISPSTSPPASSGSRGVKGDIPPPPPSIHLIPSHGASSQTSLVTIPVLSAGKDKTSSSPPPPPSVHLIPSRAAANQLATSVPGQSVGGDSDPTPPSVRLIPPANNSTSSSTSNMVVGQLGQGSPRNTGSHEIPRPRILNINHTSSSSSYSSCQLRPKGQSPTLGPLIAQRLKSLVPVARVSLDGEYVVPNEALEAEGDILSCTGETKEGAKEEGGAGEKGELPDYIDISP